MEKINCFYDIKENCNFLIYFKNKEKELIIMVITNGEKIWECIFDENFYKNINKNEFLNNLNESINLEKFKIQRYENDDLEFKITEININIVLKLSKESSIELKSLIFKLYENNLKLVTENSKLFKQNSLVSKESSNFLDSNFHQSIKNSNATGLKKFSISKNTSNRKSSYGIIKKKKPEGIKFDEDDQTE